MSNPTPSDIKKYWDNKALQLWTDPSATMKDVILRTMEIESVIQQLRSDDDVLDIGCGNAFGSIEFSKHCRSVIAVDYSEKMVEAARHAVTASSATKIEAVQGNILEIGQLYPEKFSVVTCIRCLINQPSKEEQYLGLDQLAKALKPGGRLLLIEGFSESFSKLNSARTAMGLQEIKLDWHNKLFSQSELEQHLKQDFLNVESVDFGAYYFISRIIHPLNVQPEEPKFNARINEIARDVWHSKILGEKLSESSILKLLIATKK